MQERLQYLDSMKGLAIIMVIMGHVELSILQSTTIVTTVVSYLHIPIFMFISGLLLSRGTIFTKDKNLLSQVSTKFKRLIIPFVSFSFLFAFVFNFSLKDIFFSDYKYGFWFTFTLFFLILIVLLVNKLTQNVNHFIYLFFLYLVFYAFLCFLHFYQIFPTEIDNLLSLSQLVYYYPVFVFGFLMGKYYAIYSWLFDNVYLAFSSLLIFVFLIFLVWNYKFDNLILLVVLNITGVLFVHYLFKYFNVKIPLNNVFNKLGQYSLEIYMIHFFYIGLINSIFKLIGYSHISFLILLTIFLLVISYFTGILINKSRLLKLLLWGKK